MKFEKELGNLNFFFTVQRRHRALINSGLYRGIDIRIGKAEHGSANACRSHVEKGVSVEIDDFSAFGRTIIGRPLLRKHQLRTLGQKLCAARNDLSRALVERLTLARH